MPRQMDGTPLPPMMPYRSVSTALTPDDGGDGDLNQAIQAVQLTAHAGAGRGIFGIYPIVPDRIHILEPGHIRKPDVDRQYVVFVGTRVFQQSVDGLKSFAGLRPNIASKVRGRDARQEKCVVVDHALADQRAMFQSRAEAVDDHLFRRGSVGVGEGRHDFFAKAPHGCEVLFLAHLAETSLAKQMLHANFTQFGHLFLHPLH